MPVIYHNIKLQLIWQFFQLVTQKPRSYLQFAMPIQSSYNVLQKLAYVFVSVFQEVVKHAVLCSEIPRAQAYLRRHSCPEQKLEELRRTGLNLTFSCLTQRDLQQATALLTNMVHTYTWI